MSLDSSIQEGAPDPFAGLIAAARRQAEQIGSSTDPRAGRGPAAPLNISAVWRGRYHGIREVARGGQGVVYEALQSGTKRRVAIKILRDGPFASDRERMRFEREVEILAALRHPNIVAVLESGTESGCDYVVMDYIVGASLDAFVDASSTGLRTATRRRGRESLRATLELFASICDAVNAAHLAGVVHRDLKPSNIRVTDEGVPFVLDFGLAKRARPGAGSSAPTETGQFIGTLPYSSPEQAAGAPQLDIRTDVYALGVMLYQLLTRRFPYDVSGPARTVVDRICQSTPAPPRRLNPAIDNELETILLRALAKEPQRRYQSAGALGADLRRYLKREPIEAKRDSSLYLVRKLLTRHATVAAAGLLLAASIIGGMTASGYYWRQAALQRDRALTAEQAERRRSDQLADALQAEGASRRAAENAAQESAAIRDFVLGLFKSADPARTGGQSLSVREALDRGAERLMAQALDDRPELRAAFGEALAEAYESLGAYEPADAYLRQAVELRSASAGAHNEHTLRAQLQRVELLVLRGSVREARELADQVSEALRATADADPLLNARLLLQQGIVLRELGRLDDSDQSLAAALEQFMDAAAGDELLGLTHNAIGVLRLRQKRYNDADGAFAAAHEHICRSFGGDSPDAITIINNRGTCRFYLGQFAEADPFFAEAAAAFGRLYGQQHPLTTTAENNRVALLRKLGRPVEAEELALDVLARRRTVLDADHPEIATSLNNLGLIYSDSHRYPEAMDVFREALEIRLRAAPAGHASVAEARRKVGVVLMRQEAYADAEPLLYESYCEFAALGGAAQQERERVIRDLIELYQLWGRPDEATAWTALLPPPR